MDRIVAPKAVSLKPKSWEEVPPRRAPATPAAPTIELIETCCSRFIRIPFDNLAGRTYIQKSSGAGNKKHAGYDVKIGWDKRVTNKAKH
ncbi:MAG TPA: hypothetical protein VFM18_22625 [Methanosarcina sp.]|nr:hypothetical protein [Methanosarcina sp.]